MKFPQFKNKFLLNEMDELTDFNQTVKKETPLLTAIIENKQLKLNNEQIEYLIKNSDIKNFKFGGWNYLMYFIIYNKRNDLNLNNEQIDYVIKKSDLKHVNDDNWNALMQIFRYNKLSNLNLNNEQIDYVIKNSDLSLIDNGNWNAFMFALVFNKAQNLNLNIEKLNNLYDVCDPEKTKNLIYNMKNFHFTDLLTKEFDEFLNQRNILLEKKKISLIIDEKNTFSNKSIKNKI